MRNYIIFSCSRVDLTVSRAYTDRPQTSILSFLPVVFGVLRPLLSYIMTLVVLKVMLIFSKSFPTLFSLQPKITKYPKGTNRRPLTPSTQVFLLKKYRRVLQTMNFSFKDLKTRGFTIPSAYLSYKLNYLVASCLMCRPLYLWVEIYYKMWTRPNHRSFLLPLLCLNTFWYLLRKYHL